MIRLDAQAPGFAAAFETLVNARREADEDVSRDVAAIIARVRTEGDAAVADLTRRFDGHDLDWAIDLADCRAAYEALDADLRTALVRARHTLADVREYVTRLYRETQTPDIPEKAHVAKMKKYLNFVGQSVDADGAFLHAMRRTETERDLFQVCDQHLLTDASRSFAPEPYPGVIARPNCETPNAVADGCSLETITA